MLCLANIDIIGWWAYLWIGNVNQKRESKGAAIDSPGGFTHVWRD
jgi:hypothetical protein